VTRAYLSLGSNLGDRQAYLAEALRRLQSAGVVLLRSSSLYETEPLDVPDQPWFLNLVAEIETSLEPRALLAHLLSVEAALGRERGVPRGPRTIDIDVLIYGDRVIDSAELTVPHPRMAGRRFVLEPLAELAPNLRHPVLGQTVSELLQAVAGQRLWRLAG
jgi:2-amino-4-hydroxy-6-hydroxymethyldihydropteridine diphosphokinase